MLNNENAKNLTFLTINWVGQSHQIQKTAYVGSLVTILIIHVKLNSNEDDEGCISAGT